MTAAFRFCPQCASELAWLTPGGGWRPEGATALPGLRLHALEQPDAGARGGDRMHGP